MAATVQLLKKWSEAGQAEGWDSKQNMSEMLRPAWILLGNKKAEPDEAKRKVTVSLSLSLSASLSASLSELRSLRLPSFSCLVSLALTLTLCAAISV